MASTLQASTSEGNLNIIDMTGRSIYIQENINGTSIEINTSAMNKAYIFYIFQMLADKFILLRN